MPRSRLPPWPGPRRAARAEPALTQRAADDDVPFHFVSAKHQRRAKQEECHREEADRKKGMVWTRDIGTIDPADPPPWVCCRAARP